MWSMLHLTDNHNPILILNIVSLKTQKKLTKPITLQNRHTSKQTNPLKSQWIKKNRFISRKPQDILSHINLPLHLTWEWWDAVDHKSLQLLTWLWSAQCPHRPLWKREENSQSPPRSAVQKVCNILISLITNINQRESYMPSISAAADLLLLIHQPSA